MSRRVAWTSLSDSHMTTLLHSTVGFAAVVFVGALLARAPLWWLPLPLAGDASVYLLYSKIFLEHGMEGLRQIVQSFGPDHPLAAYPLPLRLLPVWLGSLAGKLAGEPSANCFFGLSYVCSAAAAATGASIGRDLGLRGFPLAWLAALLIVSPVAAIFSVRAGVDSLLALLWCGMLFAHHRAWTRNSIGWAIATGLLFGARC